MKNIKSKNVSNIIYGIDDCILANVDRIMLNMNTGTISISSFLRYKQYMVYSNQHKQFTDNKELIIKRNEKEKNIQNRIRNEIKKDFTISAKRLSQLTGTSLYKVYRYYTIIRRENSLNRM